MGLFFSARGPRLFCDFSSWVFFFGLSVLFVRDLHVFLTLAMPPSKLPVPCPRQGYVRSSLLRGHWCARCGPWGRAPRAICATVRERRTVFDKRQPGDAPRPCCRAGKSRTPPCERAQPPPGDRVRCTPARNTVPAPGRVRGNEKKRPRRCRGPYYRAPVAPLRGPYRSPMGAPTRPLYGPL